MKHQTPGKFDRSPGATREAYARGQRRHLAKASPYCFGSLFLSFFCSCPSPQSDRGNRRRTAIYVRPQRRPPSNPSATDALDVYFVSLVTPLPFWFLRFVCSPSLFSPLIGNHSPVPLYGVFVLTMRFVNLSFFVVSLFCGSFVALRIPFVTSGAPS